MVLVQLVDYGVMIALFSIQLAFAHQGPRSICLFCTLVDALLTIKAQIGMQSVSLLYCHKCAKFHRAHMTG